MGMTYRFSRANANALLEAKDTDGVFDAIDYATDIADDLEREDFICEILGIGISESTDGIARKIATRQMNLLYECDISIVTKKMVERAIDILLALDKKVSSMPWDKTIASEWCSGIIDATHNTINKYKYTEPCCENGSGNYVYYGPSKEFVDIVKEVEKIYGWREYHYGYPWKNAEFIGSRPVRTVLQNVLKAMKNASDEFVFVLRRF